jgi:hypothetical protein
MNYPTFFDKVETITLYDNLSEFLGATTDGKIEISYLDCVKLAGHSCPTVAGAYLMTKAALEALYSDTLPQRGSIEIDIKDSETEGVSGVIGNVIGYIVGGAGVGGFKGMMGHFSRDNLIRYGVNIPSQIKVTRLDTNDSVNVSIDISKVPGNPEMKPLMQKALQGIASKEEKARFQELWQQRVEAMLLDSDLAKEIITITKG